MVARDQRTAAAGAARREEPPYDEVRSLLRAAIGRLEQGRVELERALSRLPPGEFAPDTDEPLDLPAAWRGLIDSTVHDEIASAIESLERASRLTSDPATWF
ncbi:MAG: hypothetical protein AAFY88_05225 [Acidobacteriota bacterium]